MVSVEKKKVEVNFHKVKRDLTLVILQNEISQKYQLLCAVN